MIVLAGKKCVSKLEMFLTLIREFSSCVCIYYNNALLLNFYSAFKILVIQRIFVKNKICVRKEYKKIQFALF